MGRHLRHAILLAAAALAPAVLSAQTAKTWTGTEWADFATGANWSGATAPTNNTTTHYASFSAASTALNRAVISANRSIAGVEFTSAGGGGGLSYSNGAILTLGLYGLRTTAVATIEMDVPLALGASTSFQDNGSSFWIAGPLNLGANTLTLSGNSTYGYSRLVGVISGTGGLTLNHTGTFGWILSGNNTYSGTTTLTAGRIIAETGAGGWLNLAMASAAITRPAASAMETVSAFVGRNAATMRASASSTEII